MLLIHALGSVAAEDVAYKANIKHGQKKTSCFYNISAGKHCQQSNGLQTTAHQGAK
jgi:hypothetical protein